MSDGRQESGRRRVLSGMRPTGRLHLGNYMGALYNWVKLQDEYECYFFIADYHALTTDYQDPSRLLENIFEVALDFLSAGLDPERCTLFVQSHVPQHAELNLVFSMFTPLSWLERVPTYKDQQEQLREKDLSTYGFLGYPLLQSADILLYKPGYIPVGQDQVAHVELTREVARKFNQLYSPKTLAVGENGVSEEIPDGERLILPEPDVLLTPSPKLPGIDGRKMSKSYGNSILLSEWPGNVEEKMSRMTNGGQRNPQTRPGDPDICPVGDMHHVFSAPKVDDFIRNGCRTATIPCLECKMLAAGSINSHLAPIHERRENLESEPDRVWDILDEGARRAQTRAEETMKEIREVTGLSRTRRPVPMLERKAIQGLAYAAPHDLSSQRHWWEIAQAFRERNLRAYWRQELVPGDVRLTADSDRIFITRTNKRAYVAAAREEPAGWWEFRAKVKTYELLVLLCWDQSFQMHDFIVPQIAYVQPWTAQKKLYGKEEMPFSVKQEAGRFSLVLPGVAIDITAFRGQYGPMH